MIIKHLFSSFFSSLILRFWIGLVLVATIILLIVQFLQAIHLYLSQYTYGNQLELLSSFVILVGCIVGLVFLRRFGRVQDGMRSRMSFFSKPFSKNEEISPFRLSLNLQNLGVLLFDGFIDGLANQEKSRSNKLKG